MNAAGAFADQLRAAWWAGFNHGADGGSRSADPHIHVDADLHLAWDEGWLHGSGQAFDLVGQEQQRG